MKKLLEELENLDIRIKLEGDNIKIIGLNKKVPANIIEKLKREKANLIDYLKNASENKKRKLSPLDFTYKGFSITEVDKLVKQYEIEDIYKLTPMQEGMLFHAIHDSESFAYFVQMSYRLNSEISEDIMQKSLNELFNRHEILRTVFIHKDVEIPIQIILKNRECEFNYEDIRHLNLEEKKEYISNYKNKDKKRGFILDHDVLMRVSLLQLNKNEYELIWSNHHILMDGWCLSIINNDFFEIYNSLLNNRTLKLSTVTSFKEYVKWLDKIDKDSSLKYWKDYLSGYEEQASLPNLSKNGNEFIQQKESLQLTKEISAKFQKIAIENNVTANIILQTVWAIVLGKYSNKEDIVFGSVVSGRPSEIDGAESIVGLFINNVPVRIQFSQDLEFSTLIKRVQNSNLDSETHHYISLAEIQAQSILKQNLIDHILVFENYPIAEKIESLDNDNEQLNIQISGVDTFEQTNYNLTISASLTDVLHVKFIYNANMFDSDMMKSLKIHFENVIHQIISDSELRISAIDILIEEEKHQLLYEFNNTKADYPKDKTIYQLFKESVDKSPKNIAILTKDQSITYEELQIKSDKLANIIRSKGISSGVVGIMVDRSVEMIVGLMGILNAGCCYLPIMPNTPKSRIEYFITNSECDLILTQTKYHKKITKGIESVNLEELELVPCPKLEKKIVGSPNDLAYIIYTSGTTGNPKGVMIENHSVVNRIMWMQNEYPIEPVDIIMQKTPYTFDVSVWELFWWSFKGASVFMLEPEGEKDPILIAKTIRDHKINVMHFVPSMLEAFLNLIEAESKEYNLGSMKYVFSSGEALKSNQVNGFYNLFIDNIKTKLVNLYGPTEATVDVSVFECLRGENYKSIPIGRPIDNTQLYVLDKKSLNIQAIGVTGELMISGVGLARGYVNEEKLTAEKFIPHPFKEGERLYRTGDLARWLPDGNIEFLGRIDHQIKIRGFRIELGEIESVLLKHENIKECVVIAIEENGDKFLCAYHAIKEDFNEEEIRKYLSSSLPDYMIPSYFVVLEEIPLTSNGKLNRKALPSPQIKAGDDYVAPSNEIEEKLVEIWSEVLNINKEEISVNANFFSIGGHSLKATVLTSKIHKEIGVEFPLHDVFLHSTIKSQASQIATSTKKEFVSIPKAKEQSNYPLSPAQKRLYLLQQFDLTSIAYNMPYVISLGKEVDKSKVEDAFKQIIQRHESFRTSIIVVDEDPVQVISKDVEFELGELSIESTELENTRNKFIKPFDLAKTPFLRAAIVDIKGDDSLLMIDMHHIISDGTSHTILEKEFQALLSGEELASLPLQYKDYSQWQNSKEQQDLIKDQEQYWLNKFEGEIPVLNLPNDYVRPLMQSHEGATVSFVLSKEETKGIKIFTKENDLTLYMSLLSVFSILLSKLSGQDDIVVGTPIAGRNHVDLENIVGIFINTLSIPNEVKGEESIQEFVSSLKQTVLGAYENQNYQFEDLVDKVSVERDTSRNPIFDVVINILNQAEYSGDISGIDNENLIHTQGVSKFDLTLTAIDYEEQILISFNYCTQLFKAKTIDRFIAYFKKIVNQVARNEEMQISNIDILTEEERHQLLYEFNDIRIDYPKEKTIYELFEDQVEKHPDHIALVYDNKNLTFDELNKYSNYYALNLLDQGAKGGEIIGIIQERSLNMIIGILAILKAGCTYCPINPETPQKRIQFILKECNIKILISDSELNEKEYEISNLNCIKLNSNNIQTIQSGIDQELQSRRSKDITSAYIIFTSGSTGNPKGVIINHSNIFPLLYWGFNYLHLDKHDKVIQNLAFYFDWSVWEIFISLTSGSSLEMVSKETLLDDEKYVQLINKKCITVLHITPTQFQSLTHNNKKLNSMRHLCIGAEKLTLNLVKRSYEAVNRDCIVYNMYGPTEATIMSAVLTVRKNEEDIYKSLSSIPIGPPIAKGGLVILNQYMQMQPVNIVGELYISGEGLSIGYINDPEKTSNSFIKNIYKSEGIKGAFLYKTGDLARWLPDGTVEFLGRIDHQVKIRGFRIELGEIENGLLKHDQIKESVVIDIEENGEKYLCAYLVIEEDYNEEEIRTYLSASLPDYMIPSYFVVLEKIPLNSNGKVNRKALPSPEIKAGGDYVSPSNATEEKLVEIWSEVLNIEKEEISVNANFFSIGGHSLKAAILIGKIYKELGVEFPLRDVFFHSTIKSQASQIEKSTKKEFVSIPKAKEQSNYPLSSAQKRLYMLQQFDLTSTAYNMPNIITLGKELDKSKIEEVFKQLIKRHESFRTSINIVDEVPFQIISKDVEFEIEEISIENTELENIRNKFIKPFDLSKAPFLRVAIVNIKGENSLLMIDMHHIISDGTSHIILEKEFQALLSGEELSPLPLQYKDYSEWQNSKEQQERVKDQEQYWLTKFEGEIPVLNLPTDYVRPLMQSHEGAAVSFVLSKEETKGIKSFTNDNELTLYMSLLSVFSILLSKLSGQDDIVVGTPIAGRNHADLENIVGMFVNTLSIRNEVKGEETLREFVSSLKQTVLGAYENQNYQFEDLVDKVSVERDTSRNPIFDVMINLLNQAEYRGDISGFNNQERVHEIGISKFDLTLSAIDYGEQMMLNFEYCTKLFKAETIDRFIVYFKQIVSQLARKPEVKIFEIDILTEAEKHQLLYEFNKTETEYPKDKTIHQLFEEQVSKNPDRVLVSSEDVCISYNELNIRSNQLACQLKELGVNVGDVVGLNTDRTEELLIGILGILKCGAAYLPFNSSWPKERINFMLSDSCCKILIHGETFNPDPDLKCKFLDINNVEPNKSKGENLEVEMSSSDILYIIYTSGTTGTPKGVLTTHSNVSRVVLNTNYLSIKKCDRILQLSSYTFDGSVFDIYGALLNGSSLVMINNEDLLNIDQLLDIISKQQISIFFITTALLNTIVDYGMSKLKDVRKILFGGERISVQHTQKALKELGEGSLVHVYGPTETTVFASFHNINNIDEARETIPIGKPISNTTIYLLDKAQKIVPNGVPGEIYIGSCGNALGYLNNVELTIEKFIEHPYKKGEKLYRTGDLASRLPNGNIEFLGRIDHQVKIRGFRIELGEIESALLTHENIKESAVLDIEKNNEKYLCAYIVSKEELSYEELRSYMLSQVPEYMVPSHFIEMESLPLTTNGKVNRKVLPAPEVKAGDNYVAPKTKEESLLVEVWSKVLGVEGIGVTDNFFSLGGDSIKTIQIQARLNTAGFIISVKDIFSNPTISDLAPKMIFKANEVSQEVVIGDFKLSPIQYYFLSDEIEQHHFNQSVMLHSEEYLEEEKIQSVFRKLQEHHDALRITCKLDNARKVSDLYNNGIEDFPVSLEIHDFREEKEASEKITSHADQIQRSIDLENGPLLKLGLFHLSDGDRLLIVIHHLVIDGISWRILFEDIETLFNQLNKGEKLSLPLKSNSFRDWSSKLTEYSKTSLFLKEKSYWRDIVSEEEFSLNRQIDDENIEDNELGHTQFTLDQTATTDLLNNTNEVYGTEINDILLCALGYGVKKTLGNEKVLISLEGHGREDILADIDISRTIGWFTSVYPVLLDMTYVDDLSLQIRNVKENLRQIPNKGIGFGILKYLTPPELKDNVNYDIQPQIEFNYLGQFDSDVDQMSLFNIAKESGGNPVSPKRKSKCDFSIGGMIANGKLSLTIAYKKKYYSDQIITNLLENYKNSLLEIINHCTKLTDKVLTPSDFTYKDLSIKEVDKLVEQYEIEDIYKLTPMQEGMLFHAIHDSESLAYFVQMSYLLNSEISVDIMQKSLNELFNRHEILRTVFIHKDVEIPIQIVLKNRECEFNYEDIRHLNFEDKKEEYISNYKNKDKKRGFILDQDILLRVSLLQIDNNEYELIWSNHHILMDGWCLSIINNDFFEIYNSLLNNRTLKLNSVTPFKEYVKWLDGIDKNTSLEYWKEYLSGYEEQASLPNLSKKGKEFVQQKEHLQLSKEVSAKFQKIASENNVTANIILQSVWAIVLGKYSNKEDIVFGSVVSGRPSEIYGVESIVGLFINNVPVRIQFSQDIEFSTLIKRVQNSNLDSETHHFISLAEIQAQSVLKQNLIDHILVFENYPIAEKMESLDGDNEQLNIQISGVDTFEQTNYNLTISASLSDVLHVDFIYNANIFDSETMKSLKIHFENVIHHIVSDSELRISAIDILTEEEKHQLLYDFNKTETEYPKDKTIHQLFEEQVKQFPDKLALEYENKTFTYQELNEESNKVANCLRKRNVFNEQLVGLMVNRSPEMIIGILGILKSGGAYVPIDPEYPKERINHLIKDSGVTILLSTEGFEKLYDFSGEIILLDGAIVNKSSINFNIIKNASNNLAYVMYTSGSTGQPKGVEVEHKNVVRLVKNTNYFPFSQGHKILQTGAPVFDATTFEIWGALLNGGCLHIPDNEIILNTELFGKCIKENTITTVWLTSSLFNLLAEEDINVFSSLSYLLVGGDVLSVKYINKVKEANKKLVLINGYGPTENTTFSTCFKIEKEYIGSIPIGKPISNSTAYILDKHNKIQPIGVSGELLVGGDGIARRYLNNPELTREKFIPHPFKKGERLYKTGDLAKWLPDGNIEFLGRIDHQVKIRGFRIEVGEIEHVLLKHENIKESVVLALENNGEKYLCAYVICKEELNHEELRAYMSAQVPDYMIPSYFVQLEKLPLTSNGKVNRRALPSPEIKAGDDYEAPSNEIEENLLEIWSEVLNIEKEDISVNTNFFSIGGHSLKATVLTSNIHKEIGVEFPLRDVFLYSTIKSQASQIEKSTKKEYVSIPKVKEQSNYPLASAQKRLYLLQQFDLTSTVYNIPNIISLGKEVDKSKIEDVFKQLINRHESFRTSINIVDQVPVQLISKDVDFEIEELRIENTELENTRNKFIKPFDLSKAPFLRVAIVDIKGEDSLLMIDMHHIISDGISHTILEKEFQALFSGEELAPLPLQYKDYSQWQNSKEQQELIKDQEEYWLTKFEGEIPVLNLPTDYVRPLIQSNEGATVKFVLNKEETEGIRYFTKDNDLTLYMSLLSVFNILLSKLSGQDDIVIGTPIAGRNHADLENIVGMFVNTLSIRNEVKGEETIRDFVSDLKQTVLGAYENQNYQFEDLVDKVSVERDTSRHPIFDVGLNLLNQAEYNGDISGIDNENLIHTKGVSRFDLALMAVDYGEQLMFSLEYCTQLFKAETIDRFIEYFKQIIAQLARKPEIKISAIDILTKDEKHQLLYTFNDTKLDYPKDKTIHQLFEEQVEKTPNNLALIFENKQLTYRELEKKANQLGHYLKAKGVKPESLVGISVDRSFDMIIGILGILKSGGAYVPIDPAYPDNRIAYMLQDSECNIVLTQAHLELPKFNSSLVYLDKDWDKINEETCEKVNSEVQSNNLAYVIYTSGSTGMPKGVLVEHKSVVNFIHWSIITYQFNTNDIVGKYLNIAFDASVEELYPTLLSGATLNIIPKEYLADIKEMKYYIEKNNISIMVLPATLTEQFLKEEIRSLRLLISGGDKLQAIPKRNFDVYNHYGPTEATVTCLNHKVTHTLKNIPLGRPLANVMIFITDENTKLVPIGVPGELCISGAGLARGYLKRPDLTAEKFIKNPFSNDPDSRLYKTGDLARWLPDGNIEFLGRIDHQVKIRGFRIELGEIESALLKHENIKECVLIAIEENGDKYLCAYLVIKKDFNVEEIRTYLSSSLPDYMIPSYFVELEEIPLTSNGKVNRKALPSPEIKAGEDYVAPSNETEEKLAEIWSEVLNIEKEEISTIANFFSIGGHSLKVLNVVSAIKEKFGINLPLMHIYRATNIKTLAIDILSKEFALNDFEVYNNENNNKVFCFPPMVGYGFCFAEVARLIPELCFYSFNYINTEDLIKFYTDKIIEADNQGSYKLLGYSAGCSLVSLVAKELEKRGMIVSDVILIDGYWNENDLNQFEEVKENEVNSELEKFLFHIKENLKKMNMNFLIDETREKIIDYSRFLSNINSFEIINAKVHLIQARLENEVKEEKLEKAHQMEQYTNDKMLIYSGNGEHMDMLDPEFIEENVKIIRKCLSLVNCNTN